MSAQEESHSKEDQVMAEAGPEVTSVAHENLTSTSGEPAGEPTRPPSGEEATKKRHSPVPGNSLSLPIARVKRIIKQDDDIAACSTSAVYAIASATV